MTLRKYRWSRNYESAEEELIKLLGAKNIEAERWTSNEFEDFPVRQYNLDKQLWCVEGSIAFTINGKEINLQAGDALDLPANTSHAAIAGFSGVVCYEAPPTSKNPPK